MWFFISYIVLLGQLFILIKASYLNEILETFQNEVFVIPLHRAFFDALFEEINNKTIESEQKIISNNSNDKPDFRLDAYLQNLPTLPHWLHLSHCIGCEYAYLYGSPTSPGIFKIQLLVRRLNTYSFRIQTLKLRVKRRFPLACAWVQFKLLNVDIEDLLDSKLELLLSIFKRHLWPAPANTFMPFLEKELSKRHLTQENVRKMRPFAISKDISIPVQRQSLHFTSLLTATDANLRLPVDPSQKQGVLITIGNNNPYSQNLISLKEELNPIQNLQPCPVNLRSSSVEHLFRAKKFTVDWCTFDLLPLSDNCKPISERIINKKFYSSQDQSLRHVQDLLDMSHIYTKSSGQTINSIDPFRNYNSLIAFNLAVISLLALFLFSILFCASCN